VNTPHFWVVLVNYYGLNDTLKCLQSLESVRAESVSVVLVDNASANDPTDTVANQFPWCKVIRNSVNGGWSGGNNVGVRYALDHGADQVLLLNNDTTVSRDLINELATAVAAHPDYAILGPVIYFMDEPANVMTDGCLFNRLGYNGFFQRKPVPLGPLAPAAVTEVDIVNGCAMLIRAEVFRRIGLIDERFFLIHEESDFCLRAREAGFRCGILNRGLVWHKGSSTFKRSGKRLQRYYDCRNLCLLLTKHAGSHRSGRGLLASLQQYAKYVYYRYSIELENDCPEAADAVLEGLWDALTRRFGPCGSQRRWGVPLLRQCFHKSSIIRRCFRKCKFVNQNDVIDPVSGASPRG
jgi:GT2 family glycosyltransferase